MWQGSHGILSSNIRKAIVWTYSYRCICDAFVFDTMPLWVNYDVMTADRITAVWILTRHLLGVRQLANESKPDWWPSIRVATPWLVPPGNSPYQFKVISITIQVALLVFYQVIVIGRGFTLIQFGMQRLIAITKVSSTKSFQLNMCLFKSDIFICLRKVSN